MAEKKKEDYLKQNCGEQPDPNIPPVKPLPPWNEFINGAYDISRERSPFYDNRADYNTNSKSYYDDLARKTRLISILGHRIWEYDEQMVKRLEEWDARLEHFPEDVKKLLIEWMQDGTLKDIINEEIFEDLNDLINGNFKTLSNNKLEYNYQHKRKIEHVLPLKFPHWQQFNNENDGTRLYPQSFTMDWEAEEVWIYYSPTSTKVTNDRVVAVYDMNCDEYKTSFIAGNAGGEGIQIRRFNGNRYFYVKTKNHVLGRFLLNDLPSPLTRLTPQEEYPVNEEWQFATDDKNWIFVDADSDYGKVYRKTSLSVTDLSFNVIGGISLDKSASGLFNSPYEKRFTKRQGVGLGNSKIYLGMGGYVDKALNSHYGDYGVRVLNMKGEIETDGLTNAKDMVNILNDKGFEVDRIENEGVHVSPEGKVYSICITTDVDPAHAEKEGVIIFEEFSGHEEAINFSKNSAFAPLINHNLINSSMYPRIYKGQYINQLTGEVLTNIPQIVQYMFDTSITTIKMFSSIQKIHSDYWGGNVPNNHMIEITNFNNISAMIHYHGNAAVKDVKTNYYESNGEMVEKKIYDNRWHDISLESGISSFYDGQPTRVIVSNDTKVPEGMLKGLKGKDTPFKIGTLPEAVRPFYNKTMPVALDSSPSGSFGVVTFERTGDIIVNHMNKDVDTISLNGLAYY